MLNGEAVVQETEVYQINRLLVSLQLRAALGLVNLINSLEEVRTVRLLVSVKLCWSELWPLE